MRTMPNEWVIEKLNEINKGIHGCVMIGGRSSGKTQKMVTLSEYSVAIENAIEIIKNSKLIITKKEGIQNENQNQT